MLYYVTALIHNGTYLDRQHTIFEAINDGVALLTEANAKHAADQCELSVFSLTWIEHYNPAIHTCLCGDIPETECHLEQFTVKRWQELRREMDSKATITQYAALN